MAHIAFYRGYPTIDDFPSTIKHARSLLIDLPTHLIRHKLCKYISTTLCFSYAACRVFRVFIRFDVGLGTNSDEHHINGSLSLSDLGSTAVLGYAALGHQ